MKSSASRTSLLEWFPWEKLLIWTLFLGALYSLRHFFSVIFLTFITSYTMRGLVVWLERKLNPPGGNRVLQILLSIFCFIALIASLYGLGSYVGPELYSQGQSLVKKISTQKKNPKAQFDDLLSGTIGKWLFQQQYGERGSERYQEALTDFKKKEEDDVEFSKLVQGLENDFARLWYTRSGKSHSSSYSLPTFEDWVFNVKSAEVLKGRETHYEKDWEAAYRRQELQVPGLTPIDQLTPEQRQAALARYAGSLLISDESRRALLEDEYEDYIAFSALNQFRHEHSHEYLKEFELFYQNERKERPDELPHEFGNFLRLREALKKDKVLFLKELESLQPKDENQEALEERVRLTFERTERSRLVQEWKKGEIAEKLQTKAEETIVGLMAASGKFVGELIPKLLVLPFETLLVLLLSFFITIDVPRLQQGLTRLKASRAKHFYEEIAPGLVNFGKLIGRAFQAQGIIAIANTVLTLLLIKGLGIQNAVFLCTVVFLCSFVPVLGVVFSSIPIAIMAISQENGSLGLALWAIVGILLIHFIETSLLNPKILGNMLHLHPVLVLAILAICEHFFGVWGLLLGVPCAVYLIRFVVLEEGIPGVIEYKKPCR